MANNFVSSFFGEVNRYTCFASALPGLELKDFPTFAPEEDGLIVGWQYKMAIVEPDFELEAELREANYYMETAELDLIPENVYDFVNSETNYLLAWG